MNNRHARGNWRPLGSALALSLLLHLMLLDREAADDGTPRTPVNAPLHARLHREAASAAHPNTLETPSAVRTPAHAPLAEGTLAANAPARRATAEAASPLRHHDPAPPAPPALADTLRVPRSPPAPLQRPDDPIDGEGLRQYRMSLAVAAGRYKAPVAALAGDYRGRLELRLAIAADGRLQCAQLERGSGDDRLDAAVIDMIGQAARSAPLPAALLGRPLSVALPLEFGMDRE